MVDIPLAPPTPPSSTAAAPSVASGTTVVSVSVTTLPSTIVELFRALQTSATPVVVSDNALVLVTELGNFTVSLAQQLGVAEKQGLVQQLMAFVQAQKPLTLTLQPGSPPSQGVLIIPSAPAVTTGSNAASTQRVAAATPKPVAVGMELRAIILPQTDVVPEALVNGKMTFQAPTEGPVKELGPQTQPPQRAATGTSPIAEAPLVKAQAQAPAPQVASSYSDLIIARPTLEQAKAPQAATPEPDVRRPVAARPVVPPPPSIIALQEVPVPAATVLGPEQAVPRSIPTAMPPQGQTSSFQKEPVQELQTPAVEVRTASAMGLPQKAMPEETTTKALPARVPEAFDADRTTASLTRAPETRVAAQLLVPGNEVSLRVENLLPRVSDFLGTQQATLPLEPTQIMATVIGTGTEGQLILKAQDCTLFVKTQVTASVGTPIILSVNAPKDEGHVTVPAFQDLNFEALPQALAALEQISPQIFHNVVSNFLPQPTESLTGALLFLLSAFKKGNVSGWLGGSAVETLKSAGKSSIVGSLAKELSEAGQTSQDPVVGDWRSYPIPLYAHNQFQALTLHVHSDRDARKDTEGRAAGAGKIRFLIDVRLSRLGAMQIDGFVQPKKLDMVLRSEAVLPEGLHDELRTAYIKALDAVGYAGTINFQVGRQHWMVVTKDAPKGIVT